jgi:hypothetical protein
MILKKNFNHFLGPIVRDPFEGIGPDTAINIETGLFVPKDPPGVYQVHDMAHYDGMVLSVHSEGTTWNVVEGSAVMVAPGIALTATHVIDDDLVDLIMKRKLGMFCTGLTPSGPRVWRVRGGTKVDRTDITILSLAFASPFPSDGRFVQAAMTTRLPAIGELVMIAGFRSSNENVPAEEDIYFPVRDGQLTYGAGLRIGVGRVGEHYLDGHGSIPPGPAIRVECSTPGGMSGGPAFDQHGRVVGILSASYDHPDGFGPSYVSLAWPALVHTITPAFPPHLYAGPVRLLDLDPGLCGIDRRDVIEAIADPETGIIRIAWTPW